MPATEWMAQAECLRANPDDFYPEGNQTAAGAKRVCMRCPVRITCLDHALVQGEDRGVWGGLTEQERKIIRRQPAFRADYLRNLTDPSHLSRSRAAQTRGRQDGLDYDERLRTIGVPMRDIRAWAVSAGLLVSARGRVSEGVLIAFQNAHDDTPAPGGPPASLAVAG